MRRLPVLDRIMISCDVATLLVDIAQDRGLSISESLTLKAHLAVCPPCLRYSKQSALITQSIKSQIDTHSQALQPEEGKLAQWEDLLKELISKDK